MNDLVLMYIDFFGSEEAAIEALERETRLVQQLINDLPHVFKKVEVKNFEDVNWMKEGF